MGQVPEGIPENRAEEKTEAIRQIFSIHPQVWERHFRHRGRPEIQVINEALFYGSLGAAKTAGVELPDPKTPFPAGVFWIPLAPECLTGRFTLLDRVDRKDIRVATSEYFSDRLYYVSREKYPPVPVGVAWAQVHTLPALEADPNFDRVFSPLGYRMPYMVTEIEAWVSPDESDPVTPFEFTRKVAYAPCYLPADVNGVSPAEIREKARRVCEFAQKYIRVG